MSNKKAQLGDTLTWIVATVIIFVILLFFIFGASVLGKTKNITNFKDDILSKSNAEPSDIYLTKSLFTYFKIDNTKVARGFYDNLIRMKEEGRFEGDVEKKSLELKQRLGR